MTEALPPIAQELLDAPLPCVLTVVRENGAPFSVVVWCRLVGRHVEINAIDGASWLRSMRRRPRVSLVVVDPTNALRYVSIQAMVAQIDEDADYASINALSRIYEGTEYRYTTPEQQKRYRVVLEVDAVAASDLTAASR